MPYNAKIFSQRSTMHNRRKFLKTLALTGAVIGAGAMPIFAQNTTKNKGAIMKNQVWYITGASGGLGLELAKYLLAKGDKVAATSRKLANLETSSAKKAKISCRCNCALIAR